MSQVTVTYSEKNKWREKSKANMVKCSHFRNLGEFIQEYNFSPSLKLCQKKKTLEKE